MQTEGRAPLKSSRANRARRLFILITTTVFALDLMTKNWAESYLKFREPVEIAGGLIKLDFSTNSGAAFSLFADATLILSSLKIFVAALIIYFIRRVTNPYWAAALGALLGGVVGNLYDRALRPPGMWRGEVIDWIALPSWPTFNIADSSIVFAGILMTYLAIRDIPFGDSSDGKQNG